MRKRTFFLIFFLLSFTQVVFGQANGKLQIHFMDVGQGDGVVLISPGGETVLFDDGVKGNCDKPLSYLQQRGVKKIDYHITSHYHADHIGCATEVLNEFPLQKLAYDRGGTYASGGDQGSGRHARCQRAGCDRQPTHQCEDVLC